MLPMKALLLPIVTWNGTLKSKTKNGHKNLQTTKWVNFSGESRKCSVCGVHFYKNLQFTTMKFCCRQKMFSPPTKILEIPPAIGCFCRSVPICKKSNLLFWITLTTSDHIHLKWSNKFVTSYWFLTTYKKLMTHYLLLLWACCYIDFHYHTHLKQRTNICCFHRPLFISKNSTSYLNLFVI